MTATGRWWQTDMGVRLLRECTLKMVELWDNMCISPQLAAGGNKMLRLFDVATPGRQCYVIKTHSKKQPGQPGEGLCPSLHGAACLLVLWGDPSTHWRAWAVLVLLCMASIETRSVPDCACKQLHSPPPHQGLTLAVMLLHALLAAVLSQLLLGRHHLMPGVQPHG